MDSLNIKKEEILDIRIRVLFLILGIVFLFLLRPLIAQQNYNRALSFLNIEKYNQALFHLKKCLIVSPRFLPAYERLGEIFEIKEEYEKAISAYKKMIKIAPLDPQGYLDLGRLYIVGKRDYQKAIKWLYLSLAQDEKNWEAYRWIGVCYKKLGKKSLALHIYQKMKKVFPSDRRIDKLIEELK